jgi:CHAD domain-containing protein
MRTSLSPRQQAAVERLETVARNENGHTRHVAGLALDLFDGVRLVCDFTAADRTLLELAARLHDLGYAAAPRDHVRAGVARVLRSRIPELTPADRRAVAAIMRLHSGRDYQPALRDPLFRTLPRRAQLLRLAALLRVADGLDNGHVQDTHLTRVRVGPRRIRVDVDAPHWPRNLLVAERKANLWADTLPKPLALRAAPRPGPLPLVDRRLDGREALRRLLSLEYRAFMAEVDGAVGGQPDAIHDARVALRRCAILLRALDPVRLGAPAQAVRTALRGVAAALAPARDLDVALTLLPPRSPAARALQRQRTAAQRLVRQTLAGPSLGALRAAMGRLLRIELTRARPNRPAPTAGELADLAIAAARHRARRRVHKTARTPAARHRLRIALRRLLLALEVLAPLRKPKQRAVPPALRKAVRALGRLHDVDLLLERDVKLDRAPLQAKRDRRAARADRLLQSSRVRRALRADH